MLKNKLLVVLLILCICMAYIPSYVFAIDDNDTYTLEIMGSYDSLNNNYTATENDVTVTATVKINNATTYVVDENHRINNVNGSDVIEITITDNNNDYVGVLRTGGYTLPEPVVSEDNNTAVYTFKGSEISEFDGNFLAISLGTNSISTNVPPSIEPSNPVQETGKIDDTIWFELWDSLGNTMNYAQYNEIHDDWFMKIGATIMYSYDGNNWEELSNFNNDSRLTEANYNKGTMPYVTYCFDADTVYIKFTRIVLGTGKRLESEIAGKNREIEVNKVYTLNTKNKTYGVSYDDGVRSIDWIYDMSIREDAKEDMLIKNGKAKIISIDGVSAEEYAKRYAGFNKLGNTEDGGYWRVEEGAKVTIELVPDYGYQLSSAALNGINLSAEEKVSTFTFTVPQDQLHFSALFKKAEDKINNTATDVEKGSISGAENIVSTGNVQLDVADLKLSDEMKSQFEEKVGSNKIIKYLDLNLYNIVYKTADGKEVWKDKMEELSGEVTVTLYLSDDYKAQSGNYYIIREHKGKLEELEAVYDADTNTLTFKTDKFSEYAIALKTGDVTKNDNKNSPKTGDTIMYYVIALAIAIGGSIIIICGKIVSKKKNKK